MKPIFASEIGVVEEHTFRVRAVKGNSVSEWSDIVKEETQKPPTRFSCTRCSRRRRKRRRYPAGA